MRLTNLFINTTSNKLPNTGLNNNMLIKKADEN